MPAEDRIRVIQNVSLHLSSLLPIPDNDNTAKPCNEIVFFGRHEERKGLVPFCDALDLISKDLAEQTVSVTFMGGFGVINGEASPLYLVNRSKDWKFPIRLLPDFDRTTACRYLAGRSGAVVVVPSLVENSPYTVLEAALSGRPLITSAEGGAAELLHPDLASILTCPIERKSLASKLSRAIRQGLPPARLAITPEETAQHWLDQHRRASAVSGPALIATEHYPRVVAVITHHERPAKLYDALMSLAQQTYPNLEIMVVDDGSDDPETLRLLDRLTPLMKKLKVRLLRQENRYLGAARNFAVANSESDYVLFLDDDDIAFPNLVQTLVTAAQATNADIMNCLNLYMPEARREEAHPFPDRFSQKVSYVPIGGPLSIAPLENCFGAATALIRRGALEAMHGYTERYGVGHEDFELYVRCLQSRMRIEVCPLPLYLYEVDHHGMVSSTSPLQNWNRISSAIDVAANPESWGDLVSMIAGRRAQEHADNFLEYKTSISPNRSLLQQIAKEPQQSARYAELLAEYAASVDAMGAKQAASTLASARRTKYSNAKTDFRPFSSDIPLSARPRVPSPGGVMLGILIDLSFGRVSEAITALELLWELETEPVVPVYDRIFGKLSTCADLTSEHAARVLALLTRRPDIHAELHAPIPVLFRLALSGRDNQTAATLIESATRNDEAAYLAANQDVADAVSRGEFPCGLDHFICSGLTEGRLGFSTLQGIRSVLRAHLGIAVPLSSVRPSILAQHIVKNHEPARGDNTRRGKRGNPLRVLSKVGTRQPASTANA